MAADSPTAPEGVPVRPVTKRVVPAHLLVCQGCCCGQVEKGHPEVPVAWLKAQFKERKLLRRVHLSISGCLGPCDATNVVCLSFASGSLWFGGIRHNWQYEALLDWASACAAAGRLQPLPAFLAALEMQVLRPEPMPGYAAEKNGEAEAPGQARPAVATNLPAAV